MNNSKAFKDRDIIGICWHLINYCETHINISSVSTEHASSFHSFLPTLLTYIFGSPTTRGWLQTDTRPEQEDAIRQLLDPRGHFLTALIKLGTRSEYCYDMTTEKFPDDIRKALAAGAIQYLPRVYDNCAFLDISKATTSIDLRTAATRQSSIFPRPSVGEFRIRFNMIQFYMYYFASVPTWPPLTPPLSPPTTTPYATSSLTSTTSTSYYGKTPYPTASTAYSKPAASASNTTTTDTAKNNNLPYLIPGHLRSLSASVYNEMIQLYMRIYIPCVINDSASYVNGVGTFFLDTLIELWIRTVWISPSQKLSLEFVQCLVTFLKYVVGGDLRRCTTTRQTSNSSNNFNVNMESAYTDLYRSIKDELYLLLSRLSSNWRRQDDYIWVLNIWTLWAAPWRLGKDSITLTVDDQQRLGNDKHSSGKEPPSSTSSPQLIGVSELSSPLETGWAIYILENAWYYITLVDSFLQRTSTFTYPDRSLLPPSTGVGGSHLSSSSTAQVAARPTYLKAPTPLPGTTTSHALQPLEGNSLRGELNILQQLVNVWKSKYMVDYLGQIEDGLEVAAQNLRSSVIPPNSSITNPMSSSPATFLQNTRIKFSSALTSIGTDRQQQQQQKGEDILGNLSSICCAGDRSNTNMVMQQLERLRDQIFSIYPTNSQQWKPSNIYSAQRHPRSDHLIKSLQSLYGAMETRMHSTEKSSTWKNSVLGVQKKATPISSKDVATLSAMLTELSSLLKLPFPDGSQTMPAQVSANQASTNASSASSISSTLINRQLGSTVAPSSSTSSAFLTSISQKNDRSSWTIARRERPKLSALGPRAEICVRSFENKFLLHWVLSVERRINSIYYWSRIPFVVYTPDYVSLRWMAAPINLVYLFMILLVVYFIYSPFSSHNSL